MAKKKGACCAGQDIYDAKRVAETIGIPHYVLDYESRFRKKAVIEDFAETAMRGAKHRSPACAAIKKVKFADLLDTARELGAERDGDRPLCPPCRTAPMALNCMPPADSRPRPELFSVRHHPGAARLSALSAGRNGKERSARHRRRTGAGHGRQARQPGYLFRAGRPFIPSIVEKLRPDAARPGEIVDAGRRRCWASITAFSISPSASAKAWGLSGNEEPLFVLKLDAARNPAWWWGPRAVRWALVGGAFVCAR